MNKDKERIKKMFKGRHEELCRERELGENLELLNQEDIHYFNLNQGIFKDVWYYGKVIKYDEKEVDSVITSDKKIFVNKEKVIKGIPFGVNEIKTKMGVEYRHTLELDKNFWSNESIKKFLLGQSIKLDKKTLYSTIKNLILYYMDLLDERIADVVCCWVLGTYCYELFETYGGLYFNALRGSGKSKFKKILRLICFNGTEASNISEASFFRTIENSKGTLCLDEYEKLDDVRKKLTDQLLNAGIEKGAAVKRQEKINGRFIGRNFDVYCPKVVCNISGMNPTTQSRFITIKLLKTRNIKGKRKPKQNDKKWQKIRDLCYLFVMKNWETIKKLDESYDYSKINNRNEDVWRPLFIIGKFFGDDIEKELIEYSEINIRERKCEEITNDWKYILLKGMLKQVKEEGWYTVESLLICIVDITPKSPNAWVGRQLANMPLFKHKYSPNSEYFLNKDLIVEMMRRLDYPIPDEYQTTLVSSKSSNASNTSKSSNTSKISTTKGTRGFRGVRGEKEITEKGREQ